MRLFALERILIRKTGARALLSGVRSWGTTFSPGPDGGRDFVYDVVIKGYEPKNWAGYLVVQAKFKDKPEGSSKDIMWLKSQVDKELLKLKELPVGIRRPEYYIVATNVALSGSDGKSANRRTRTGGYTKISSTLEQWKDHAYPVDTQAYHW